VDSNELPNTNYLLGFFKVALSSHCGSKNLLNFNQISVEQSILRKQLKLSSQKAYFAWDLLSGVENFLLQYISAIV
jgi:hypothetical protein